MAASAPTKAHPKYPNLSHDFVARSDANESIYLQRQLDQALPEVYGAKYPDLKARMFVAPSPTKIHPGAQTYRFRSYSAKGIWKVIHGMAQDLPRVNLFAEEDTGKIRRIGASAGWTDEDLEHAQFANMPLSSDLLKAARDVIEEGIDETIAIGLSGHGITGLLNNANVTTVTVATATGGEVTFDAKRLVDPDIVINDVLDVFNDIKILTKETETPDTLLLPESTLRLLSQTRLNPYSPDTMLDEIKRRLPSLTLIAGWYRLETAGGGGSKRGVMYCRSQRHLWHVIAKEFTTSPLYRSGVYEYEVGCDAKVGGVNFIYPLSATYFDGI